MASPCATHPLALAKGESRPCATFAKSEPACGAADIGDSSIEPYIVYGVAGTGSVAVEAALTLIGAAHRVENVDYDNLGSAPNPVAQVPALRLPSGELMTESLAILIWLADAYPEARLAPATDDPARPAFLRWMAFVSAAIYAHYWARDFPARVVTGSAAQAEVKAKLEARIADGWKVMEAGVNPGRYLLGDEIGVLDLYVTVVSRWTPREALHDNIAPRIGEVVRRIEADRRLTALWAERFALRAA